jgi:hypothetical protein
MRGPERGCREWGGHLAVRTLARPHPRPPALSPAACWHPRPHTLARAPSPARPHPRALAHTHCAHVHALVRTHRHRLSHSPTPSRAVVHVHVRALVCGRWCGCSRSLTACIHASFAHCLQLRSGLFAPLFAPLFSFVFALVHARLRLRPCLQPSFIVLVPTLHIISN